MSALQVYGDNPERQRRGELVAGAPGLSCEVCHKHIVRG